MKADDVLLLAAGFRVGAFRKADGEQLWETVLVSGFFKLSGPFVTLVMDDSGVYAHAANELFRLDMTTGKILWQKKVPTFGRDIASLALARGNSSATATTYAKVSADRAASNSGGE